MTYVTVIDVLEAAERRVLQPGVLTDEMKQQIVAEAMKSSGSARPFARFTQPLIRRTPFGSIINTAAVGRSMFPIQKMPDAALPIYDKDVDDK